MLSSAVTAELKKIVGTMYCKCDENLVYGYDATLTQYPPDAVVFPGSTEEVAQVQVC